MEAVYAILNGTTVKPVSAEPLPARSGDTRIVIISLDDVVSNEQAKKVAVVRSRVPQTEALGFLSDLQRLMIERHDMQGLQTIIFQLAYQHQRSVYDAS